MSENIKTSPKVVSSKKNNPVGAVKSAHPELVIFETGGKQIVSHVGEEVIIEKIKASENKKHTVKDLITGKTITLVLLDIIMGPKIRIWKFKNKTRYIRRQGHRQKYTKAIVESVS